MKIVVNAEADLVGYLYAYVGLISVIFRTKIIPWLVDRYPELFLQKIATGSIVISLFMAAFFSTLLPFFILMTIYAFGSGIARPLITGSISKTASEKEQGAVMGVTNSLGSIAQIFGPIIGGLLLNTNKPETLLLVSASFMFWGFLLLFKNKKLI